MHAVLGEAVPRRPAEAVQQRDRVRRRGPEQRGEHGCDDGPTLQSIERCARAPRARSIPATVASAGIVGNFTCCTAPLPRPRALDETAPPQGFGAFGSVALNSHSLNRHREPPGPGGSRRRSEEGAEPIPETLLQAARSSVQQQARELLGGLYVVAGDDGGEALFDLHAPRGWASRISRAIAHSGTAASSTPPARRGTRSPRGGGRCESPRGARRPTPRAPR